MYTNKTYQDYYPFGKEMLSKQFSPNSYRFSFNGKEDDTEWMA